MHCARQKAHSVRQKCVQIHSAQQKARSARQKCVQIHSAQQKAHSAQRHCARQKGAPSGVPPDASHHDSLILLGHSAFRCSAFRHSLLSNGQAHVQRGRLFVLRWAFVLDRSGHLGRWGLSQIAPLRSAAQPTAPLRSAG